MHRNRTWIQRFRSYSDLLDRPLGVLGDQGFGISRRFLQHRQIGLIAHIPQGYADISQKSAAFDSFDRRIAKEIAKF